MIGGGCHSMRPLPPCRCALRPVSTYAPPRGLDARGVQPVATDQLHAGRWDVLGKLGEDVQGVEEVRVLSISHSTRQVVPYAGAGEESLRSPRSPESSGITGFCASGTQWSRLSSKLW